MQIVNRRKKSLPIPRFFVLMLTLFLLVAGLLGTGELCAQNYPTKPIRILTAGIGGGHDVGARIIAEGISGPLGQPVIVDNRAGGFGIGQALLSAPADGHTLMYYSGAFWIGPLLQKGAGYDTEKDFDTVCHTVRSPNVLVVHPSVPAKTVQELIDYAKANPGKLNFSSGSAGTGSHIAGHLFAEMAGVKIVNIRYKSAGQEAADLIGGHVHMSFGSAGESVPKIKSGQMRGLAVCSPEPSPLIPGLPTVAATLPGFTSGTLYGFWVKAKTPEPIIRRLNQELVRFLKTPAAKAKFLDAGMEVVGSTPEEHAAVVKADLERITKLLKTIKVGAD